MLCTLPNLIVRYVDACNAQAVDDIVNCFADDAEVHDEGGTMRGKLAIKTWARRTIDEYRFQLKPIAVTTDDNATTLTNEVSGTFDGSPARLTFCFTIVDSAIALLTIK